MENAKLTRNTISISYNLDKTAQVGYFVLTLLKDNQPVYVKDVPSVTYYRKGTADIKTWTPTVKDGFVYLNANDFSDIHKSGTYYITCILSDGDIYPSQGSAILTLEGDLPETSEVQIQPITGANGKDGASITGIQLDKTQTHFIFTMSNGQTIETSVSMPDAVKGDKGEDGLSAYQLALKNGFKGTETEWLQSLKGPKGDSITGPQGPKGEKGDSIVGPKGQDGTPGKDAPHVTRVTYSDNQLSFSFSDGSSLSTPFVMPTPTNGKNGTDGKDGKNAPTIENVSYANDELTFAFSDGTSKSTPFVMPTPTNGKNGANGKDAPVVTSVNYADNQLTFIFSDGTHKSTSFIMPVPKDGKDGKDAPHVTNVDLNDDQTQLIFTFSDGSKLQTDFKAPEAIAGPKGDKGQDGTPGKDAPHVTRVTYSDNQLSFSFSDGSSLSTPFVMPTPKDGKDGKNGKDAPTVTSISYNNNKLIFNFSDGTSNSSPLVLPEATDNVKDEPDKVSVMPPDLTSNLVMFTTSSDQYVNSVDKVTKNNPFLKVSYNEVRLKYKKGNKDTYFYPNFIISFKQIFDELDTKANKSDVPTSESISSQIDQKLKEKLKKNIVSKITPPGFVDDTGTRVQSGLSISSYNLNGDTETMSYTSDQIVALDNSSTGYNYDIPITKLFVNDAGLVSMWLQGSLIGNSQPKKFSIGKTDISYPDPGESATILSTDNKQGSSYSSNAIQIRNRSDYFSGLPVTVVNANIKEATPEARQAFKQAFSDFNSKFYFLHIEG